MMMSDVHSNVSDGVVSAMHDVLPGFTPQRVSLDAVLCAGAIVYDVSSGVSNDVSSDESVCVRSVHVLHIVSSMHDVSPGFTAQRMSFDARALCQCGRL